MTRDKLPPFDRTALLLDLDGTLLDLAPTPDTVVVPEGLVAMLIRLRGQLDGALAVITGRPIEAIDLYLPDVPHAVAGEHGGSLRAMPGGAIERPDLSPPPAEWLVRAAEVEAAHPGSLLERKERGFGIHFRLAESAGPAIHAVLSGLVSGSNHFELMGGTMLWEVRPKGIDKGHAVAAVMRRPPFLGRVPVFIGDDVTDEDGMRAARAMGGAGLRVPDIFGGAPGCRAWLHATAERGDWSAFP